ncbi:MAG: chemotaxis protein CheW [Chitinivibrionales bacterium]|nr:chemotaxis protein CheW [Chitinivibrionales bacterium]
MSQNTHTDTAAEVSDIGKKLSGKYLTFILGDEEYGLEILKVQEIIQMQKITKVPKAPEFVRGVINLRGKVIPVIELRAKFCMASQEDTDKTCIIVVQIESKGNPVTMGIIIDEVKEVLDIKPDEIEEAPTFGSSIDTDFIMGIGKLGENVKMLLDIQRVLSGNEVDMLSNM